MQQYGENIELKQDNKRFTLTIYVEKMATDNKYIFEVVSDHIEGLKLPIYCGKDVNNQHIAYDMVSNPHLLIAGESGGGKSTQVRQVLTTLIKTISPYNLHFYLADMKRSEFHLFRRVEHVKKVCTRVSELMTVLTKLKKETEKRGDLLDKYEVTHIDDLPKEKRLPYIILCIDEVALLKKEKEAMEIIEDISAIGRALGMFLILSMQRPDAKVLDGKLKVNLTVRMGFRSADLINSRIIGTPGAEKISINERGRFFLKLEQLRELQAPFLKDDKAKALLEPYKVEVQEERVEDNVQDNAQETPVNEPQQEEITFGVIEYEAER